MFRRLGWIVAMNGVRRYVALAGLALIAALGWSPVAALAAPERAVCPGPVSPGHYRCLTLLRTDIKPRSERQVIAANALSAVVSLAAPTGDGYGPADLQRAYNLSGPAASNGTGETIGIVDAFNDPNIASDLATYRSAWGLPACTVASGCFRVLNQNGATSPLPANAPADDDWSLEESLDVDMASAICPNCNIVLVEADSDNGDGLFVGQNAAIAAGAQFVSDSFGGSEVSDDPTLDAEYYHHPGIVETASAGDSGYGVSYPAASSDVTAVGGTTLTEDASVPRGFTETAWNGSGSGCSDFDSKPSWQTDSGCTRRTDNDVAADANGDTGVAVYDTFNGDGGWNEVGGTSASSPMIAATYALAGPAAAGDNPASYPYAHPTGLYDVTSGSDGSCSPSYLCTATAGYDGPTGLGTPDGLTAFSSPATMTSTTTHLTSSLNPAPTGQSVTFSASVASVGGSTPTGTVTFTDGSATLGSATLGAGGTATLKTSALTPGTHSITATYGGDAAHTGSSDSLTEMVADPPLVTISAPVNNAVYALNQSVTTSFTCTPGAGNGAAITSCLDQNNHGSGASLDTSAVGAHTLTVTATDGNQFTATATATYTVKNAQTISFPATAVTYGQTDFSPASASSSLAVSYGNTHGQCEVDGQGLVQITGAGSCTVTASQPGNSAYLPAAPVTQTFTINPASLSVNAKDATTTYGQPPALSASLSGFVNGENASSAQVTGTANCTTAIPPSQDPGTYPGAITCAPGTLSAPNYTFASGAAGTLTINQASQTISFPATAVSYGHADYSPASASSGLTVSYGNTHGQCQVDGQGLVQITGAGSCTVTASQSGNNDYASATAVTQTFTINPASLSVNASDATTTYGQTPALSASLSGFVNGENAASAQITGTAACTATPPSPNPGTYPGAITCASGTLAAPNYAFAIGHLGTLTITQAGQTITFTSTPPSPAAYATTYAITATGGGSSNPVLFSIDGASTPGACAVTASSPSTSAATVSFTGVGTCIIDANQAGNADYTAAAQVQQKITITPTTLAGGGICKNLALTGQVNGNLTVPAGSSCLLTAGTTVNGNVTDDGTLTDQGATIAGNLQTQNAGALTVSGQATVRGNLQVQGGGPVSIIGTPPQGAKYGVTINGNLQVQSLIASTSLDQICATSIGGTLQWQTNAAPVTIGGPGCAGNLVGGNLQVRTNTMPSGYTNPAATIENNTVRGNLQTQANTPTAVVSGNTVGGNTQLG